MNVRRTFSAPPLLSARACFRRLAAMGAFVGLLGTSHAANLIWSGAQDDNWGTADNWTPSGVPNLDGTDTATIANGNSVVYDAAALGDLNVRAGSSLTISGGSTVTQATTHWSQLNGGSITLDGGALQRTAGGNVVVGFLAGTTNSLSLANGASLTIGGEFWFGHNGNAGSRTSTVSLDGSSIITNGTVGIWFWDPDAAGTSFALDFIPGSASTITVADRLGRRNAGSTDNQVSWETLWDEGLLAVGGSTAGAFSDYFTTTGTNLADGTAYTLTFTGVPEPGSSLLAAGALAALSLRRRRR